MSIKISSELCTGCEACVEVCPFGAMEFVDGAPRVNEKCNLCGACVEVCPVSAIDIEKKIAVAAEGYSGVWVFAEQRHGLTAPVTLELLGEGKRLAEKLQVALSAVLFGNGVGPLADELFAFGADNVFLADDPVLESFTDDLYGDLLAQLIRENKPEILLCGATAMGRSFIPKVANQLDTGLTADCTELGIRQEDRLLLQTRPAFGGNIMATILCPYRRPQMATVRPKVMKPARRQEGRTGKLIPVTLEGRNLKNRITVLESINGLSDLVNFADAEIVVSGGRGMGSPEGFALIRRLADLVGGVVGASRGAVDSEWIGYAHQVGQTGKTVSPKVYIACGISGAVQHLVGMQSSDVVIAINRDPDAPIFSVANYGLVGDVFEILPALIAQLESGRK